MTILLLSIFLAIGVFFLVYGLYSKRHRKEVLSKNAQKVKDQTKTFPGRSPQRQSEAKALNTKKTSWFFSASRKISPPKGAPHGARKRLFKNFEENFLKASSYPTLFIQAGLKADNAVPIMVASKILIFVLAFFYFYLYLHLEAWSDSWRLVPFLFLSYGATYLFDAYLKHRIKKRVKKIEGGFADILDLFIVCLQGGLNFAQSLERVARESFAVHREIALELALLEREMSLHLDKQKAFNHLNRRVPSGSVHTFTKTISQALSQGSSVLQSLVNLASEIRYRKMLLIDQKIEKLPGLMSFPVVLIILPNVFILFAAPKADGLLAMLKTLHLWR